MPRTVLYVSKPIVPPYHDGTKCLVRDIARHLTRVEPVVMGARGSPSFSETWTDAGHVRTWPVYRAAGGFSPGLAQNVHAAWALLTRREAALWHFVFAPNPRSSKMARFLKAVRGVPVVQTVASPPRTFDGIAKLMFGDVVVAQSEWTRQKIQRACEEQTATAFRTEVIVPPVPELAQVSSEARAKARAELAIGPDAPLYVYPGDLEVSGGAERVAEAVPAIVAQKPDAVVVFAYRAKSPRAEDVAKELRRTLPPEKVRVVGEVPEVLPLISEATAVLFPVEDLWGKVDLPIVVLEAMSLGVPIVVPAAGPLSELGGPLKTRVDAPQELVDAALALADNAELRARVTREQVATIERRHRSPRVSAAYERLYLELLGVPGG